MMELEERLTLPRTLGLIGPRATITSGRPVADAIENLKRRYLITGRGAVRNLTRRLDCVRLLGLYYELFPKEFLASKASWTTARAEDVEAAREDGDADAEPHTERELEFLELVNRHLFELPLDWIENGLRLDRIMFASPFGNWEEEGDPDRYMPALQLAGCFLTDGNWISVAHIIALMIGELDGDEYWRHNHFAEECDLRLATDEGLIPAAVPYVSRRQFWDAYERIIRAQGPPISYMNDAVNVMARDTGVTELDASCMCGQCGLELEWTRANVEALAAEHKQGQELFSRIDELDDWLKLDPERHVAEQVVLWNYAAYHAGLIELTRAPRERQLKLFEPN